MKATIRPSRLTGSVIAPASKSSMQRALAAALIRGGKTIIQNPGYSNDDKAAVEIVKALGGSMQAIDEVLIIESTKWPPRNVAGNGSSSIELNTNESGLSLRMFTSIAALSEKKIIITGQGSLLSRPIGFFEEVLPQLGVKVNTTDGKLPMTIQGPLQPTSIEIDGSLSSQYLTGLLMAYAAADAKDVSVKVKNLQSKPYIDLTLNVMKQFGMKVPENRNYNEFYFGKESQPTIDISQPVDYRIESDWSSASFLLVAGAIAGSITVRGLDLSSSQADKKIIDALMSANAAIATEAKGIRIHTSDMTAFEFDATDCPDLFPPLVALASYCTGETFIKGARRLTHKESNRAYSLQTEFVKMGVDISTDDDIMIIRGNKNLVGAQVSSHHDHRIAMAAAIAGLNAGGETTIDGAEAVNKSYPQFYDHLKKLGADVSLDNKIRLYE